MMVDDDYVALECASPHLGHEAALELLALGADAALGAGIELGPELACFRDRGKLGAIAGHRHLLPFRNRAVLLDLFQSAENGLIGQLVKLLPAQIVVATLHVTDAQARCAVRRWPSEKCFFQERNVFIEELLLQCLGPGRDDDALAGANDRKQVGKCLSRAGSCFDDEVTLLVQRLFDSLRHRELSLAELVGWVSAREQSAGAEELVQREPGDVSNCGLGR
jgi:hypothetical protein